MMLKIESKLSKTSSLLSLNLRLCNPHMVHNLINRTDFDET